MKSHTVGKLHPSSQCGLFSNILSLSQCTPGLLASFSSFPQAKHKDNLKLDHALTLSLFHPPFVFLGSQSPSDHDFRCQSFICCLLFISLQQNVSLMIKGTSPVSFNDEDRWGLLLHQVFGKYSLTFGLWKTPQLLFIWVGWDDGLVVPSELFRALCCPWSNSQTDRLFMWWWHLGSNNWNS